MHLFPMRQTIHTFFFHCYYGLQLSISDDKFHKKVLQAIKLWLVLILYLFRQIALLVSVSDELIVRKKDYKKKIY